MGGCRHGGCSDGMTINNANELYMKENVNTEVLKDAAQDARRALDREREEMRERMLMMDGFTRTMDAVEELIVENERQRATINTQEETIEQLRETTAQLRQQLQEEHEQRSRVEMQLNEMSKLSASVAGKASQDELLKALRVFVNKSKRKKLEKRIAVKEMVMELAMANNIVFPGDLAATLDCLDDEQTEARVVQVTGNYNDVHDNGSVELGEMV